MSSSKPSKAKSFIPVSVVTLLGAAALIGDLQSMSGGYVHERAAQLASLSAANTIDPVVGYHAAMLLDRNNDNYRNELAERYISAWEPQKALDLLNEPHQAANASHEAVLRSRALMELDRGVESVGLDGDEGQEQLVLVKAAYSSNERLPEVPGGNTATTALAKRVRYGGLPLAQELVTRDMPQSALRVLERLAPSVERQVLITQIQLARRTDEREALQQAREALDTGLKLEPASINLRELSREQYRRNGDQDGLQRETQAVERLQQGTF